MLLPGFDNTSSLGMTGSSYTIQPSDSDSEVDEKWAQYLCSHMQRRGGENARVKYGKSAGNSMNVEVHVDAELSPETSKLRTNPKIT